jgi:hypothetical protein
MLIIPATISGFRIKVDGSAGINLATGELSNEQLINLKNLNTKFVFVGIKPESFTSAEKDLLNGLKSDLELKEKTPGQRLRNVLFISFEQNREGFRDFDSFYKYRMNKIVDSIKNTLE